MPGDYIGDVLRITAVGHVGHLDPERLLMNSTARCCVVPAPGEPNVNGDERSLTP